MESAPPLWGIKKTLKVALPLMCVAGLVVYAYLPHDQKLKVSAAKGGECILVPDEPVVNTLRERDCDRSHDGEIYAAFKYPGAPAADSPTPAENCLTQPDGLTADETRRWQQAVDILTNSGNRLTIITNNADETADREYICVVVLPERTGSYLQEVAAQIAAANPTTTVAG